MDVLMYYMTVDATKYNYLKLSDKFFIDTILGFVIAQLSLGSSEFSPRTLKQQPRSDKRLTRRCQSFFDPAYLEKLPYLHGAACEFIYELAFYI